jgi:hypothetical protein
MSTYRVIGKTMADKLALELYHVNIYRVIYSQKTKWYSTISSFLLFLYSKLYFAQR